VIEQLSTDICSLCSEEHPPKFHCFAQRTYKKDQINANTQDEEDTVGIRVPRIICKRNHLIRIETGESKQYTLTILPGFLIPYSTIRVDPVHKAVESYITQDGLKQVGAAQRMNCLSAISFRLFFSRVRTRLENWMALLLQLLITLEGQLKETDVSRAEGNQPDGLQPQWGWFVQLAAECVRLYERIPGSNVVPQHFLWQYVYSYLSRHQMGLGP